MVLGLLMAVAAVQIAPAFNDRDWVSVEVAAQVTGESLRTWQRRAEALAPRGDAQKIKTATAKAGWYVHRRSHSLLLLGPTKNERDQSDYGELLREGFSKNLLDDALGKKRWLDLYHSRVNAPKIGGQTKKDIAEQVAREAKRIEGALYRIGWRTLQLWQAKYKAGGLRGLVSMTGQTFTSPRSCTGRSTEAVEYFLECYRTQSKFSVKQCHDMTLSAARQNNWRWPVCYSATAKWLRDNDDLSTSLLDREGPRRWSSAGLMPYVEKNYGHLQPSQQYMADHHQLDLWCTHHGGQIRPWLTMVLDSRTRCLVGWHIGPSPNSNAIMAALLMAFKDWAIPDELHIDNGKDFCSKLVTGVTKRERAEILKQYDGRWEDWLKANDKRWLGVAGELGIKLTFAPAYAPWSKGPVERFFRTCSDQFAKTWPTFCGNAAFNKPEALRDILRGHNKEQKRYYRKKYGKDWFRRLPLKLVDQRAIPTMVEIRAAFRDYVEVYHRDTHRFTGGIGECVPLAEWNKATRLRRANEDQLLCVMWTVGDFKVAGNGVRFKIAAKEHGYGKNSGGLKPYHGRYVTILADPNDLSYCIAMTAGKSHRYIARLESNERIAPMTTCDDERQIIAETMRDRSVMAKSARSAWKRTMRVGERSRAHQINKLAELKKTGTDGPTEVTIVPVRTGFEDSSNVVRRASEEAAPRPRPYEHIDVPALFADDDNGDSTTDTPNTWTMLKQANANFAAEQEGKYDKYDADDMAEFVTEGLRNAEPESCSETFADFFEDENGPLENLT